MVHEAAERGFGAGADAYVRGRPSYPAAAVELVTRELHIRAGTTVVDVGAGTGKFTELLVPTGARVVAVEPVANMRAKLEPPIEAVDGTGESLPFDDASVDAITVAQAFHWFRHDEALAEFARVLKPGGGLALVWNRRDESVPWVESMSRIIEWRAHQVSEYDRTDWPAIIGRSGRFAAVEHASFAWEHVIDRDGLAERVRSVSYIAAMDDGARREAIVDEVLALTNGFGATFPLPYNTLVWWTSTRSATRS
ncbi:MAG TPA: class I SAM-dependent methyltransferase [Acidimicrobiales bacterium]|jgi:SAM-dependent methyltransferase|nr:class I SAM-dependent methyltransferase [Acidimicrobiales bacterium]